MPELALWSYVDERGRAPFEAWILDLDPQAQAKVTIALSRLQRGNMSNVKGVGEGVCELKLDLGAGVPGVFRMARRSWCSCAAAPRSGKTGTLLMRRFDGRTTRCANARSRDDQDLTMTNWI
jgi:putative addiction module killer protein